MKNILLIAATLAFLGSCTFQQDVTFNKNWSGEMQCRIDMSAMSALIGNEQGKIDMIQEEDTQKKLKQLKATPGIKKVKVKETENGVYSISYTFKDIRALNQSGNILFADENAPEAFTFFDLRDPQTLYFSMPFGGIMNSSESESEDGSMAEGFVYELTMKFPKKIQSLDTENGAVLSGDKKQVILKTDLMTMTSEAFKPGMLVKFEK